MEIQKGQKLTDEQEQQRAESRERNREARRLARVQQHQNRQAELARLKKLEAELAYYQGRRVSFDVSKEEMAMLLAFGRRNWQTHSADLSTTAMWAMKFALCNPVAIFKWVDSIVQYGAAEGVDIQDYINRTIIEQAAKLAGEPA